MKMFNLIGIDERAGDGIPNIYQVWEDHGWVTPVVEESYNPDRTRLLLEFTEKQATKTSNKNKQKKQAAKTSNKINMAKTEKNQTIVREYL